MRHVCLLLLAGCVACSDDSASSKPDAGSPEDAGTQGAQDAALSANGDAAVTYGKGLFTQPQPWTKDVSALSPSSESGAIIAALKALGGWGSGSFRTDDSLVLLEAKDSDPRVNVAEGADYYTPDCETLPAAIPLPTTGSIEGEQGYQCTQDGDCHLLLVARNEHKLYELYQANRSSASGPIQTTCLVTWDLNKAYPDTLRGEQCTSSDAAGLPVAALTPTADEVFAGEVPHALRFILPNARMAKGVYVHPATHAGAPSSTNTSAPPYGVRFRLKQSFDENKIPSQGGKVLAQALKKYGMILSDGGNIPITIASDKFSQHKWSEVGITNNQALSALTPDDFEVVDLGPRITLTYDCVRN
jgi:hypothetical protein